MSAFIAIDLIAFAVLAAVSVMVIIPSCNTSMFRYRLWRVRDGVYDQMRTEQFEDPELADTFITFIEGLIRFSGEFTAFRLAYTRMSGRRHAVVPTEAQAREEMPFFFPDCCSAHDRSLLKPYLDDFQHAAALHLAFGTPGGWVLTCALAPILLLRTLGAVVAERGRQNVVAVARGLFREELRDDLRSAPQFVFDESRIHAGQRPQHQMI